MPEINDPVVSALDAVLNKLRLPLVTLGEDFNLRELDALHNMAQRILDLEGAMARHERQGCHLDFQGKPRYKVEDRSVEQVCANCKYWSKSLDPEGDPDWDRNEFRVERGMFPDRPQYAGWNICLLTWCAGYGAPDHETKAFCQNTDAGGGGELLTAPDFGCVQFEAKG